MRFASFLPSFLPSCLLLIVAAVGSPARADETAAPSPETEATATPEGWTDADGDGLPEAVPTATPVGEETRYDAPASLEKYDVRQADPSVLSRARQIAEPIRNRQRLAADVLEASPGEVRVHIDPMLATPRLIVATTGVLMEPVADSSDWRSNLNTYILSLPDLFLLEREDIEALRHHHEARSPKTGILTVTLSQDIAGKPILGADLRATFNADGELVFLASTVVPHGNGMEREFDFALGLSPESALASALAGSNLESYMGSMRRLRGTEHGGAVVESGPGTEAIVTPAYLPFNRLETRPVWSIVWGNRSAGFAYAFVVDAESGRLLTRGSLSSASAPNPCATHTPCPVATPSLSVATFEVFVNGAPGVAPFQPADSPAPWSPGPTSPGTTQPPLYPSFARDTIDVRALDWHPVSGSSVSPLGWLSPGVIFLDGRPNGGNNIILHDYDGEDEDGWTTGVLESSTRAYEFALDLTTEIVTQPANDNYKAAAAHGFVVMNWAHDRFYELGFDEAWFNSQKVDFGCDRLVGTCDDDARTTGLFEALNLARNEDVLTLKTSDHGCSPSTILEELTPSGPQYVHAFATILAPRITGLDIGTDGDPYGDPVPVPRNSGLATDVLLHEYGHFVDLRIRHRGVVGGPPESAQLAGIMEGTADFLALSLLSEPGEDPDDPTESANMPHAIGGYYAYHFKGENFSLFGPRCVAFLPEYEFEQNAYFGVRRFPYSTDHAMNPLTAADMDADQIDLDAAPLSPWHTEMPTPVYLDADLPHNMGEVWCSALWQCRANLIDKYGYEGNEMMMQIVIAALQFGSGTPTMAELRDSMVAADILLADASGTDNWEWNRCEILRGFASRGFGRRAWAPSFAYDDGSGDVLESFLVPVDCEFIPSPTPTPENYNAARIWENYE